jgi:hypothetical protein
VENARYGDLNSDIPVCLSTRPVQKSRVIDGPVTSLGEGVRQVGGETYGHTGRLCDETVTMPKGANKWSTPNKGDRRPGRKTGHAITKSFLTESTKKV